MNISLWIGIIGTVLTFVSLIYAVYAARSSRREKRLVYELLEPVPIFEPLTGESRFHILIEFAGEPEKSEPPKELKAGLYAHYVRFANVGREPIRRVDNVESDPLRLEIFEAEVLDVSLVQSTRDVCAISLGEFELKAGGRTSRRIVFDFMDQTDGALLQVFTNNPEASIIIRGTIVGMPGGLTIVNSIEKEINQERVKKGCLGVIILQVVAILAVPAIFRSYMGSWKNWWVLLLPVVALMIPFMALILGSLMAALQHVRHRGYPIGMSWSLKPPDWYAKRLRIFRMLNQAAISEKAKRGKEENS